MIDKILYDAAVDIMSVSPLGRPTNPGGIGEIYKILERLKEKLTSTNTQSATEKAAQIPDRISLEVVRNL